MPARDNNFVIIFKSNGSTRSLLPRRQCFRNGLASALGEITGQLSFDNLHTSACWQICFRSLLRAERDRTEYCLFACSVGNIFATLITEIRLFLVWIVVVRVRNSRNRMITDKPFVPYHPCSRVVLQPHSATKYVASLDESKISFDLFPKKQYFRQFKLDAVRSTGKKCDNLIELRCYS